jgi:hypothetical protein
MLGGTTTFNSICSPIINFQKPFSNLKRPFTGFLTYTANAAVTDSCFTFLV